MGIPGQAARLLAYPGGLQTGGCFLATEKGAILITDVVGSTELSQRLSSKAAHEVRRKHSWILRQAAEVDGHLSDLSQELSELASDDQRRVIGQLLVA